MELIPPVKDCVKIILEVPLTKANAIPLLKLSSTSQTKLVVLFIYKLLLKSVILLIGELSPEQNNGPFELPV